VARWYEVTYGEPVDVSVIIVSHDEPELVAPCLDHVQRALESAGSVERSEILLVANLPDSLPDVAYPGLQVVRNVQPIGFAANVNRAMSLTDGKYRLLVNPDLLLTSDALDAMIGVLESDSKIAAVGPRQVDRNGQAVPSARRFPTAPVLAFRALRLDRVVRWPGFYRRSMEVPGTGTVDWVNGACMLIDSRAWAEVGPFHEGYRMYYEDIDWCDRAARCGWSIWLTAGVTVIHDARRTSARWPPNRRTLAHATSILRYLGRRRFGRLDP
jgi:N-acetylglucosaminyl-diphospho-decaprenol L-rhamnosyltransferase